MAEGSRVDVKEMLIEGFYAAKELVAQIVRDFRSRDRFFKYKAGIIAAWLAVSGATLAASCGGGPHENSLHAHTQVTMLLDDTTLLVRNDSSSTWRDVRLTLDGKYSALAEEIPAGGKFVLAVSKFVGAEGQSPAKDLKPRSLRIICSEGTETIDLTAAPNGE